MMFILKPWQLMLIILASWAWNPISDIPKTKCEQKKRRPDGMARARYYQSLLDSGVVQTRAELARYLGVSRARVTQVLNRLDNCDGEGEKSEMPSHSKSGQSPMEPRGP